MGPLALRPYQSRGIDFGLQIPKSYFAVDMGLGKTAIILHILNRLGIPSLCVAPLKVTYNTWPDEIVDWDLEGEITYEVLHGPRKNEAFRRQTDRCGFCGIGSV